MKLEFKIWEVDASMRAFLPLLEQSESNPYDEFCIQILLIHVNYGCMSIKRSDQDMRPRGWYPYELRKLS